MVVVLKTTEVTAGLKREGDSGLASIHPNILPTQTLSLNNYDTWFPPQLQL